MVGVETSINNWDTRAVDVWINAIYLKPFVDAFGVIFVAARQNAKRLTSFEFAHANDASALATFFDLPGKSIRR